MLLSQSTLCTPGTKLCGSALREVKEARDRRQDGSDSEKDKENNAEIKRSVVSQRQGEE